ncbi:AbrB/MazE/SpoVT family DNA-binding domain-containing protein [Desulfotomaculum copahuensis]|uniref:AbrB/MazE/SpoVT family DNA-binding domain-containing protein n=1 Tax=Desulfotomaculum copahuensis TaxID=1838280 RepID=UPI0013734110|nr:AbrB/MazE/SpoVT family DNA-binding domain-containing protein [Desulfotomaculum copahuensis]
MEYTTLTSKGQVTVPKEIREKFNWKEGTRLKFYLDGEELKVKEVTIIDEMEDLITKDLKDIGYCGEKLKTELLERKAAFNKAFDKLLEERLKEETVPLVDAIRSIESEEKL